ncbi:glucokinase [Succinivibrio sp.]|jgi:glucokinase|uniref:glucokinase n=1 Tax=Succinivibrio sp. TaxID=2053619 RepID=UPI0025DAA99C|nr:glucokinase [uncultured Succinivibrio sp.]
MEQLNGVALVGDVGGTNARLALVNLADGTLSNTKVYSSVDNDSLEKVIIKYREETGAVFDSACIAIATMLNGDHVKMTNNPWEFSISEMKKNLNLEKLIFINDFTAMSMSVTAIKTEDMVQIGGEEIVEKAPKAIYGAGTGLGVGYLIYAEGKWIPLPTEGGHVDIAVQSDRDDSILKVLRKKFDHVSGERLLSGQGLVNTYQAIAELNGHEVKDLVPADVTGGAFAEDPDPDCKETVDMFCKLMGSFGGNLALNILAKGGVYIAGGIVPRFIDYFKKSEFRSEFESKGRFNHALNKIPVYVISQGDAGLLGAGAYVRQELGAKL